MYQGRFKKTRKKKSQKPVILLICLLLTLLLTTGTTAALLYMATQPVPNTFAPAQVSVEIQENKTNTKKTDIQLENPNGNNSIPVYVRATLVIYWQDQIDGIWQTIAPPAGASVSGGDVQYGWIQKGDIYYYTRILNPGETTSVMLSPITVTVPEGSTAKCIIDVRAEAIQAEPASAVASAWGVSVDASGNLS